MQFTVDNRVPHNYGEKFIIGALFILCLDGLWLYMCKGQYDSALSGQHISTRRAVVGYIVYSLIAGAIGAVFSSSNLDSAAACGALVGFLVFSVFNITTVTVNKDWSVKLGLLDTTYGTVAWTLMLMVQHQVQKI